jgi:hypothetical protein
MTKYTAWREAVGCSQMADAEESGVARYTIFIARDGQTDRDGRARDRDQAGAVQNLAEAGGSVSHLLAEEMVQPSEQPEQPLQPQP